MQVNALAPPSKASTQPTPAGTQQFLPLRRVLLRESLRKGASEIVVVLAAGLDGRETWVNEQISSTEHLDQCFPFALTWSSEEHPTRLSGIEAIQRVQPELLGVGGERGGLPRVRVGVVGVPVEVAGDHRRLDELPLSRARLVREAQHERRKRGNRAVRVAVDRAALAGRDHRLELEHGIAVAAVG